MRSTERENADEEHQPLGHSGVREARLPVAGEADGQRHEDHARDRREDARADHHVLFDEQARDDRGAHEAAAPRGARGR